MMSHLKQKTCILLLVLPIIGLAGIAMYVSGVCVDRKTPLKADSLIESEVNIIAEYIGFPIITSARQVNCYFNSADVIRHLYVVAELDKRFLADLLGERQWVSKTQYVGPHIEMLSSKIQRATLGEVFSYQDNTFISFWDPNTINYVHYEMYSYDWGDEMMSFIEEREDTCKLFVIRSCHINRISNELLDIFPQKANWDIREYKPENMGK